MFFSAQGFVLNYKIFFFSPHRHRSCTVFLLVWQGRVLSRDHVSSAQAAMSGGGHATQVDDMMTQLHNNTPLIPFLSPRPTWQRLEQCWHLSCLSGLILWLCLHGVRPGLPWQPCVNGASSGRGECRKGRRRQRRLISISIFFFINPLHSCFFPLSHCDFLDSAHQHSASLKPDWHMCDRFDFLS